MELSVLERVLLLGVLPKEGDITTLRIVQQLREELSFSEEEHQVLGFVANEATNQLTWNPLPLTQHVTLGPKAQALITEALERLNREKKLTAEFIGLYDRFVG